MIKSNVNGKEETIFPHRLDKIKKTSSIKSFTGDDGTEIFGTEVTMHNGDTFGVWSSDKDEVQLFENNERLLYKLKKIEDNGKVKNRLESFQFMLPRKVRAETDLVDNINSSVFSAAKYAAELSDDFDSEQFKETADEIFEWMKDKFLEEEYGQ